MKTKGIRAVISLSIFFSILLFCAVTYAAEARDYDVVVLGAGSGGSAAAIAAARLGARVAVVEESDWVGGQIAASAVSTMDDLGRTRTGIYREFIERVKSHYMSLGLNVNICLWGGDTIATEPKVARDILLDMMKEAGRVDLFMRHHVADAETTAGRVSSITIAGGAKNAAPLKLNAKVFIDATEFGDFIPLTGARYRVGNSVSPEIDPDANVQDITYVAVVKKYPNGMPPNLLLKSAPQNYEKYVEKFRRTVAISGDTWPGSYPFDVPTHNAYRALPNSESTAAIVGDVSATWPFITRTCINWANDYPGAPSDQPGLSVRYIEDRAYRREAELAAMEKTLGFLWYLQTELGKSDWSVDDGQGYGGYFSNDWRAHKDLPKEYAPLLSHFPPYPYVRESRRIVGVETLMDQDISRDIKTGEAYKNYKSAIALGEYPVDIHGSHLDRYMEHDLGETSDSFPKEWVGSTGVFQIPLEALIPETLDGLVAAEKNISVSRMVNGATRLQPITMLTGQAAGTLAALAAQGGVAPRAVRALAVQRALLGGNSRIALISCADAMEDAKHWKGIQWASVYRVLDPMSRQQFGATLPLKASDAKKILSSAYPSRTFSLPVPDDQFVKTKDFLSAMGDAVPANYASLLEDADVDDLLLRGEALSIVFESLTGKE